MNKFELSEAFKRRGLTLGAAESFTGGLFASEITSVSGASEFFKGSLVTYATEEKTRVLGISKEEIERHGVVSGEAAYKMALAAMNILNTHVAISFTGNAGPEAMENKPVGEVYIAIAFSRICQVHPYYLTGTREQIRQQAINIAYDLLAELVR